MNQYTLTIAMMQEAVDAFYECNKNITHAAQKLGISRGTFQGRYRAAMKNNLVPSGVLSTNELSSEQLRIKRLEKELNDVRSINNELMNQAFDITRVKDIIHGCNRPPKPPKWITPKTTGSNTGIPTLLASDWHLDEVVQPMQVNGVNAFNRAIAEKRVKQLFTKTTDLLINHMAKPKYDFFQLDLGGDIISGSIHEELRETNEQPVSKTILFALDLIVGGIDFLLPYFPKIKIECVCGNHGRWDRKPRFKNRAFENYEWLLYQFLMRHYNDDDRVHINVSDGADILYSLYDTRYLLTHGDQFKGGSGISGALSPLMIGDARKRKRSMATDQPYDYMVMGHWHQLLFFKGIIVNGALKGYDEYAFQQNFDFELPTQALWITHPEWGITARWPVYLERPHTRY